MTTALRRHSHLSAMSSSLEPDTRAHPSLPTSLHRKNPKTRASLSWKPDSFAQAPRDAMVRPSHVDTPPCLQAQANLLHCIVGGHCKPDLYNVPSSAAQKHGIRAGVEIAEFELANLEAVREYVQEEGVDCDFQMTQAVDVQLDEAQNEALKRRYDEFVAKGGKVARRAFYTHGEKAEMVCSYVLLLTFPRMETAACMHAY